MERQLPDNNNLIINYKNKTTRIHIDQVMPFYVSDNVEDNRDFSPSDGIQANFTIIELKGNVIIEEESKVHLFHEYDNRSQYD